MSPVLELGASTEKRAYQNCYDKLNELSCAMDQVILETYVSMDLKNIVKKLKEVGEKNKSFDPAKSFIAPVNKNFCTFKYLTRIFVFKISIVLILENTP